MRRHDLAYLSSAARPQALGETPSVLLQPALEHWVARHRPLVVARQLPECAQALLAVTLLVQNQRQRCHCLVSPQAILRLTPPLSIHQCLETLPKAQATLLERLDATLRTHGITAGVYGSLAWEVLGGPGYRHPQSDIDLVCDVDSLAQSILCLEALHDTAQQLPCALDGEIRFPDQRAVSWKEWAAAQNQPASAQVLVKGAQRVELCPVTTLLESLAHA